MWPFTSAKKLNRVDVMDILNLHRYSRDQFKIGVDPTDPAKQVPIAFKKEICSEAVNAINRSKHPVEDYFGALTLPDKSTVTLSDGDKKIINDAMKVAESAAKDAAVDKKSITERIAVFEAEIEAANEVVKEDMSRNRFGAENYRDLLFNHKADIETQLIEQHSKELKQIEELGKTAFQAGLTPSTKRDALILQMKETLEAKQKEELEKFNKKMDEELKRLMDIRTADISRLAFLGLLARSNANAEMLHKLRKHLPSSGTGYSASSTTAMLFGIKPTEITQFETASGKIAYQQGGDGAFTIASSVLGRGLTRADFLAVSLGVKAVLDARGIPPEKQTITASVSHTNPDTAKKLGKKAYEAAVEAGFDASNITINVNGKEMKPQELGVVKVQAVVSTKVDEKTKRMVSDYNDEEGNKEFKEAVKQLRESSKTPPAAGTTVSSTATTGTTVSAAPTPADTGTSISGSAPGTTVRGS